MGKALADILALLCAVAGWFYLFYSSAAGKLSGIESPRRNARRTMLRRVCGGAMFLLAVGLFAGFNSVDERSPGMFLALWCGVLLLLALILVLALVDMRMTRQLREQLRQRKRDEHS